MIHIVADSTSDLSKELLDRYDITILPLHVIMDDREYLDGVNVTPEQIYEWSDRVKKTPKTSALSFEDGVNTFRKLTANGDEIIVFSISSEMSTTYNVMKLAAEELPDAGISIIDSKNLSTGIGLEVIEAAELAKQGLSRLEIVERIEALIDKVRASFVIDTLVYLYRGGRCNSLAAIFGSVLKLHPRIDVINGAMQAGQRYRGKINHVTLQYAKDMEEQLLKARPDRVFITYSPQTDPEVVKEIHEYLESLGHFKEIFETHAGSVISSHCGPGTLGVLFIEGES